MTKFRSFLNNNGAFFALGAAIVGLAFMTICIGAGLSLPA